jgi:hypothetical protein
LPCTQPEITPLNPSIREIGRSVDTIQFKFDIFAGIAGDLRPSRFWTVIDIYNRNVYHSNLDILSVNAFMPSAK